jgi:hypothetical protein
MTDTGWPYDADQNDPLTARRIPVTGPVPDWGYVVAFDETSPQRPDDLESAILESYAGYRREYALTAWDRRQYGDRPFDMGNDNATVVLRKRGAADWTYRASNWPGTAAWAQFGDRSTSLLAALDHYEGNRREWDEWKAGDVLLCRLRDTL